jgi:hypothetical protein
MPPPKTVSMSPAWALLITANMLVAKVIEASQAGMDFFNCDMV